MSYNSCNKAYEYFGARSPYVATSGIFSYVFVDFDWNKNSIKKIILSRSHTGLIKTFHRMLIFSRSYTISSIYSLVVGNMAHGKRHTPQTEPVLVHLCVLD